MNRFNFKDQPATIDKIVVTDATIEHGERAYIARVIVKIDPNLAGLKASPFGQHVGNESNGVKVVTKRRDDYGIVDVEIWTEDSGALPFAATFAAKSATMEAEDGAWCIRFGLDIAVDESTMHGLLLTVKKPAKVGIVSRQADLFGDGDGGLGEGGSVTIEGAGKSVTLTQPEFGRALRVMR